jgi:hypothetical protein
MLKSSEKSSRHELSLIGRCHRFSEKIRSQSPSIETKSIAKTEKSRFIII